jgi:hypothetical protein
MLNLRPEFRGKQLKGTQIDLVNSSQTGATQQAAKDFLEITYPTRDVLMGVEAVGPHQGRCIVIKGERGLGKSHLMAVLYHTLTDQQATRDWLQHWAQALAQPGLASWPLRPQTVVIAESLQHHKYKTLWDLIFDRHPQGAQARARWDSLGPLKKTQVPPTELLEELFAAQPTALILDEFQTWFDGLTNSKDKEYLWKEWAFNFIQNLSETAKNHPEHLVLVVSIRNGESDAFQQIQRVGPLIIDFQGEQAKTDRRRLLLHRLFENRLALAEAVIEPQIATPAQSL